MDYCERTLLKLRRQYDKDEVVSALYKKLSDQEIEIGKLKSEIDFLNSELQPDKERKEIIRISKIEARKNELYQMKVEEIKKQRKEIRQLRNQKNDLIAKCYNLEKLANK